MSDGAGIRYIFEGEAGEGGWTSDVDAGGAGRGIGDMKMADMDADMRSLVK